MPVTDTQKARWEKRKEYILSKKKVKCMDCGGSFPDYCMDFHHIDEESKDPAFKRTNGKSMMMEMQKWSIDRIDAEIDKCEIICACCHRIRHHKYK